MQAAVVALVVTLRLILVVLVELVVVALEESYQVV
jgi:hypothetical protein